MTIYFADGSSMSAAAAGKVIQVQSTLKQGTAYLNLGGGSGTSAWTDVTGVTVSITPASSSNKILVLADLRGLSNNEYMGVRLMRGSTAISVGNSASGNRSNTGGRFDHGGGNDHRCNEWTVIHRDRPSTTSSVTYKVQVSNRHNSTQFYLNYPKATDNNAYTMHMASNITAMEIAA